jgi:putative MATE family efflux protein
MNDARSKAGRFTTGGTMRHVVVMTLTGSVGLTFMFLIDFATLFYISLLGDEKLTTAIGYAWTIQFFTISVGIGFAIAATALVSRALGARNREQARRYATSALTLTFLVLAITGLTVLSFRGPLLDVLGATGEVKAVASRFLLFTVPSLPLMAFGMAGASILRAEGDAGRAMMVTLAAGMVAMVMDPLLIFGFGMGVDGAAVVMVISRGVTGALGLYYVVKVHDLLERPVLTQVIADIRPVMIVALPATATQLSTPFGNFLLTSAMSEYGDSAVAGWSVVSRLTVLVFGGIFALSGAIGGIIGQNHGAGQYDRVKSAYRDAMIFSAIYVSVGWLLLVAASGYVADGFSLSETGAEVVRAFCWYGAGGFIFAGALFVANAAFNNLGRPVYSTLFNWSRDAAAIPLALMAMTGPFLAPGVVYAQAIAGVLVGGAAAWAGWRFVKARHAARPKGEWGSAPSVASGRAATALQIEAASGADEDPNDPWA